MIYTITLNPAVDRELVVPQIVFNSVLRAAEWRVDLGGKGFNVSRMLLALGQPSIALGFAGGNSGAFLQQGLEDLGIATDFVWVAGETRTNVSIVTSNRERYVKVNEPGPAVSPQNVQQLLAQITGLVKEGDWWVLSGSLPPGAPAALYAQIIDIIQGAGAAALLDSSGDALHRGCKAGPYMAKPNEVEAGQLSRLPVGNTAEIAAAAKTIQQMGVHQVLISLGKQGVLWAGEGQNWLVDTPQIEEKNPIGAGDSLLGGVVWGLAQGLPPEEAIRWGVASGAATAAQSGTAVGTREEVERLLGQVRMQPQKS